MIQPRPPAAVGPDLAVGLPSVSNSAPTVGTQFTLSAIVRNDGDTPSAATTLRYYQVDGCDDHDLGHGGGDGRSGRTGRLGDQQRFGGT